MKLDLMRDMAKDFPVVDEPASVVSARIWFCRYQSLAPVARLVAIEDLEIAGVPDSTLDFLRPLSRLQRLSITHLPSVSDLGPLAGLLELESLSLATTPGWDSSGKVQRVASLAPLRALPRLKHLELFGVLPADGGLADLEGCRSLQSARFSKFPAREVKRFYAATGVSDAYNPRSNEATTRNLTR